MTIVKKYNILIQEKLKKMGEYTLAIGDIIVGVDIGTKKVTVVVGEINKFNQVEVICTSSSRCKGIKKSKIKYQENVYALINH